MGKKNVIYLIIVFIICVVVLLGILVLRQLQKPEETTTDIHSDRISGISFIRHYSTNTELRKEGGEWKVRISDGSMFPCSKREMNALLEVVSTFKLIDVVAEGEEYWDKFELNKASGVYVDIYYDGKNDVPAHQLVIGKRQGYDPNTSYARFIGSDEVWIIIQIKRYIFDKDLDYWMDKVFYANEETNIESVTVFLATETVKLEQKNEKEWWVNGTKIKDTDSVGIFFYNIVNFAGDGFKPEGYNFGKVDFRIQIKGKDSPDVTEVIFGVIKDKECPIKLKGDDKTIYWMHGYKIPRYKKFLSYFKGK